MPPQPNDLPPNEPPSESMANPAVSPDEPSPAHGPDHPTLVPDSPDTGKKNSRKRLILLMILLLATAGLGIYLFTKSQNLPVSQPNSINTTTDQKQPSRKQLYFQNYTKVIAYDPVTQQKQILTDKLPPDSKVLDLYVEDATWRLYYYQTPVYQGNDSYRISYLEKDQIAQEVMSVAQKWTIPAANAKSKTVAYTEVFDPGASGAAQTSRHYAIKDGTTTKIYESAPASQNRGSINSLANIGYVTDSISPDGGKILYAYVGKFYSESPPYSTGMEYEIATKTATLIYEGGQGALSYQPSGSYIIREDTDVAWFGTGPDALKQKLYALDKPGGKPKLVLELSESSWLSTLYSRDYSLLASTLKDPKDPHSLSGSFGQLYKLDNNLTAKTPLEILNLPVGTYFTEISNPVSSCYGVVIRSLATSTSQPGHGNTELGMLCVEESNKARYSKIEAFDDQGKTTDSFKALN